MKTNLEVLGYTFKEGVWVKIIKAIEVMLVIEVGEDGSIITYQAVYKYPIKDFDDLAKVREALLVLGQDVEILRNGVLPVA